jgi:hypothetical protein
MFVLPPSIRQKILTLPERQIGYKMVNLICEDKSVIRQVQVLNSEIAILSKIPSSAIVDVELG